MSPASYLTAPPRDAASIVAALSRFCAGPERRLVRPKHVASIAAMSLFWLSLAVALVATIASLVYLTVKGLEIFRTGKQLSRRAGRELERISAMSAEIERRLESKAGGAPRLDASLARLRRSQAELNVLTSALADARAAVRRFTAVVPRR